MTKIDCSTCGKPFLTEDEERSCPDCERESLEDYDFTECPICFGMMEFETCWQCGGEGGSHDCGEDTCCCLDPEEITDPCGECKGVGGYMQCSALPHSDEQMKAHKERQEASNAGNTH